MNLYLISQTERTDYDTYDSAVVAAPDEETARRMHPGAFSIDWTPEGKNNDWTGPYGSWASHPDQVTVTLLGTTDPELHMVPPDEPCVICASFNAG